MSRRGRQRQKKKEGLQRSEEESGKGKENFLKDIGKKFLSRR